MPRDPTSPPTGIPVDYLDTPEYHRPDPIRRLLALATSSAIAILLGILAAIAIAATLSFAVIHFTRLLQG
ncbi:MAG: hypothetical protein CSA55_04020 [Ilumatobacter coccineus]|uniref:Uncharacterized protein n=1 Tax=Ilumatobacter coccineus TaxID=467094 RepID=A0A2G6KBC3_9ACTN|nr:MAG: hypothetical protein CSA55_04020 [Ilumatobacter coccineus]